MSYRIFALLYIFLSLPTHLIAADSPRRGIVVSQVPTAEEVALLKSWNVNVVRYPLTWGVASEVDASTAETYRAWLLNSLDTFDVALTRFEAAGIKVILNLHIPPGGFSSRVKASYRVFEASWAQESFMQSWELIAARYLGRTGIAGYDLMNEPAQQKEPTAPLMNWNALAQRTAERVRAIDASTLLYMTPVFGKITRLKGMKPLTVSNVGYTIHFYEPWAYIHQGIPNVKLGTKYPTKNGNRSTINKSLSKLASFKKKHNAPVFVGEFSVARWAPNAATYLKDTTSLFEKYGFDWTYHAFRESHIWDLELGSKYKDSTTARNEASPRLKVLKKYWSKNQ
jgi:endoglucanase